MDMRKVDQKISRFKNKEAIKKAKKRRLKKQSGKKKAK